jgi:hypothetical protein
VDYQPSRAYYGGSQASLELHKPNGAYDPVSSEYRLDLPNDYSRPYSYEYCGYNRPYRRSNKVTRFLRDLVVCDNSVESFGDKVKKAGKKVAQKAKKLGKKIINKLFN